MKPAPTVLMRMGRDKAPDIKSANAILMTKNKLLLRSLLLTVKRTRAGKFAKTIKTASNVKALHHAIPSALEGRKGDDILWEPKVVDEFSILK